MNIEISKRKNALLEIFMPNMNSKLSTCYANDQNRVVNKHKNRPALRKHSTFKYNSAVVSMHSK